MFRVDKMGQEEAKRETFNYARLAFEMYDFFSFSPEVDGSAHLNQTK